MNQEQHSESEPYQPDTSGDETLSEDSNKKKRIAGKSPRPFIIPDETDSEDDLQKPVHYEKKWIKKKFMVTEGLRPVPHAYDEGLKSVYSHNFCSYTTALFKTRRLWFKIHLQTFKIPPHVKQPT